MLDRKLTVASISKTLMVSSLLGFSVATGGVIRIRVYSAAARVGGEMMLRPPALAAEYSTPDVAMTGAVLGQPQVEIKINLHSIVFRHDIRHSVKMYDEKNQVFTLRQTVPA